MKATKTKLQVLPRPELTGIDPPASLHQSGADLWRHVQDEYRIEDVGGLELLTQCCGAADRLAEIVERIARDGLVIETRGGPRENPLLKMEIQYRSFICRTLQKLNITCEPLKGVGRPPASKSWAGPLG